MEDLNEKIYKIQKYQREKRLNAVIRQLTLYELWIDTIEEKITDIDNLPQKQEILYNLETAAILMSDEIKNLEHERDVFDNKKLKELSSTKKPLWID